MRGNKKPDQLQSGHILEYSKQTFTKIRNPVTDNQQNYISFLKKLLTLSFITYQSHTLSGDLLHNALDIEKTFARISKARTRLKGKFKGIILVKTPILQTGGVR